ncbi:ATP-grasp domain-containing protein (plasmid) [Alkalihalophilus sp. As8PL]|uniref:ATP-grasp domain-containing protein n=1 Tax=Alkalihalophilus sp. As8PL TaxID=3237103 RepID=A0AB39BMQ2_9BACI
MKLLIIGGTNFIYERAIDLGYKITLIDKKSNFNWENNKYINELFLLDYEEKESEVLNIIKSVHSIEPFHKCVSFTEKGLSLIAEINKLLGFSDLTNVVQMTRQKDKFRECLKGTEFTTNSAAVNNKDEVRVFAKENGFPCIVKPNEGVGSKDIKLIKNIEDINSLQLNVSNIIESFIEGQEYTVETYSKNREHKILGVGETILYDDIHFVEKEHRFPAVLDLKLEKKLTSSIQSFLDYIGLKEGPAHTEVKYDGKQFKIIESHTRPGGDFIPDLIEYTNGIDIYSTVLDDSNFHNIHNSSRAGYATVIRFLTIDSGIVTKIAGLNKAKSHPLLKKLELSVKIGDQVNTIKNSFDRPGYIITVGKNLEECLAACDEVENALKIITE